MSDYDLIIRGGTVVRPQGAQKLDLGIRDGQITALGNSVFGSTDADLDATDLHLLPGLVDPNVHFNEPGRTYWEGFEHGSRALAAGGYTAFFDMPLYAMPPVLDKSGFLEKWNCGKANSLLDFGLWGGLTPESLPHLQELTDCGVIGFKAYMCGSGVEEFAIADDATLFEGMQRAFDLEQIVAVHAENDALTSRLARRAIAEGRLTARDYLESRPVIAELEAIQRAIMFAWETECALHIVHVSTARGVELVANAKAQGMNISCETCPHYLILTEADLERLQSLVKCAPPLRGVADQQALWNQLATGAIDMISSDHSSAPPEMKFRGGDMFSAWGGIAGCQSTLPLMLTAGAEITPPLTIETLADLLSTNVARRFRLYPAKGALQIGTDADVVIVKLGEEHALREEALFNRYPEHSPYIGRQVYGRVVRTILRGQTIFNNGRIVAKPAARLLRPAENSGS